MDALRHRLVVGLCEELMAINFKVIDVLLIPKEGRGDGRGTEIMNKLCGWADVEESTLVVSADSTVCGRAGSPEDDDRLIDFYSRFGFSLVDSPEIFTDSIWTSKNIMHRQPVPLLSQHIATLSELRTR